MTEEKFNELDLLLREKRQLEYIISFFINNKELLFRKIIPQQVHINYSNGLSISIPAEYIDTIIFTKKIQDRLVEIETQFNKS